jgi:hypothetical protein
MCADVTVPKNVKRSEGLKIGWFDLVGSILDPDEFQSVYRCAPLFLYFLQ